MKLVSAALCSFWGVAVALLMPVDAGAVGDAELRSRTLVVGRISSDPKKTVPRLEVFSSYLAARLSSVGINGSDVLVARDVPQMVEFLREGKVDLVSETAMSALRLEEEGHARILLREWKRGVSEYFSVFFSRKENGFGSLNDLIGRKIAFEDRNSTTAFYLPLAELLRAGLEVAELAGPEVAVPPGKVGYVFADSEINIALWVARGLVDAGAYSDLDWLDHDRSPEAIRKDLAVFHRTAPILRSALLARRGLAAPIQREIEKVLLSIHEDPAAVPVLGKYYHVRRFDPIEGEALRSLDTARSLIGSIREYMK